MIAGARASIPNGGAQTKLTEFVTEWSSSGVVGAAGLRSTLARVDDIWRQVQATRDYYVLDHCAHKRENNISPYTHLGRGLQAMDSVVGIIEGAGRSGAQG